MKKIPLFILAGMFGLFGRGINESYSQSDIKDMKVNGKTTRGWQKEYDQIMKTADPETFTEEGIRKATPYIVGSPTMNMPKYRYSNQGYSQNNRNFNYDDALETGYAIIGAINLIDNIASLFSRNKNRSKQSINDYENSWSNTKQNQEKKSFWESENNTNSGGSFWGGNSEEKNLSESNNSFWEDGSGEYNNNKSKIKLWNTEDDISNLEKDLLKNFDSKKRKIYVKYVSPMVEKGLGKLADKVPFGNVVYEVIQDGPNHFWLKKVKNSEKIIGKLDNKGEEIGGGIEMIIDDLTGNYRTKVYNIAKASQLFWGESKAQAIKRKYGINSKEYLEFKMFGTPPDSGTETY